MATATKRSPRTSRSSAAVVRARCEPIYDEFRAAQAGAPQSWFRVWFQAGDGDEPHIDSHVVRASCPAEARGLVERHERQIARELGRHSFCAPEHIHATSVDILADHCAPGEVDG